MPFTTYNKVTKLQKKSIIPVRRVKKPKKMVQRNTEKQPNIIIFAKPKQHISMKRATVLLTILLIIAGFADAQKSSYKFHSGDLLFCLQQKSDMEKAIGNSTGEYTHVAIVDVDSTSRVWIIEASGSNGVRRIPYSDWSHRDFCAYRLNVPFDTAAVIARAKSFLGQPYDDSFLPDNGQMYCSELVYEAFLDANGNHLFKSQPMNFRDKRGKMPKYWKKHFRKLGIAIPEGVEGTNPSDMAKSPLLTIVL